MQDLTNAMELPHASYLAPETLAASSGFTPVLLPSLHLQPTRRQQPSASGPAVLTCLTSMPHYALSGIPFPPDCLSL